MKFSLYSSKPNPLSLKSVTIFFGFSGILVSIIFSLHSIWSLDPQTLALSYNPYIYIPYFEVSFPSFWYFLAHA